MKTTIKKILCAALAIVMILSVSACGGSKTEAVIKIYDGKFSEMHLMHRMAKFLVEEHTDVKVEIMDEMDPSPSFAQLVEGNCDLMNSYDGTLLTTFLKLDPKADVPAGQTLYDFANEIAMEEYGVRLLDKIGAENTYCIAVPESIAEEYGLETISDLVPVAEELVFVGENDFFTEEGSAKFVPFTEAYGLTFKDRKPVDVNLKYSIVETGEAQVMVAYSTDGANKKYGLKILKDDLGYFPEYNIALLVRDDLFERMKDTAPDLEEVLNKLGGIFTNELMTDLTYQVDVEQKNVDEVARQFLKDKGLIA